MRKKFGFILVFLLSLPALFALFPQGLPITHDGADHLARIANFYASLTEGIMVPRWAGNLNWGYGHPVLMFLYPFPSYVASFFHFIGFSYIDSLKFLFGIGFIASGLTMYLWAREQFDEYVGIASATLYMYAPYRFVDMYVRGAIGEHVAFIFPPLILYCMYKLNTSKSFPIPFVGVCFSFALLLLSHNAISLMFVPVFVGYAIYLAKQRKEIAAFLFMGFVVGFLLSAFFTIPAFLEGKFTLRDIVANNEYATRFVVSPLQFLYGKWSYGISGQFTVQIGVVQILGLLLLPFLFLRKEIKKREKIFVVFLFVVFLCSLLLQLQISNGVYEVFTTLKKFQFPWRFLTLTVFSTAILSSIFLLWIKNKIYRKILLAIFIVIALVTNVTYYRSQGYFIKPDTFYNSIYNGTTDTGESAPIWSVRFMEKKPTRHIDVILGEAAVTEVSRTSTEHAYKINVLSEDVRIRENTIYFPSWKVIKNEQEVPIEFQDPANRGLITFHLPKGEHDIVVKFFDTKLRTLSNIVSIASFISVLIVLIVGMRNARKQK